VRDQAVKKKTILKRIFRETGYNSMIWTNIESITVTDSHSILSKNGTLRMKTTAAQGRHSTSDC